MTYALDAGGLRVPLLSLDGAQAVAVRCLVRLYSIRGEWADDPTRGLPGLPTLVLLSPGTIRDLITAQLERVAGVVDVTSVTVQRTGGQSIRVAALLRALDEDGAVVDVDLVDGLPYAARSAPGYLTIQRYTVAPHVLGGT